MDTEKLNRWAKEIHDNATAHGWHEEKHSSDHCLNLIIYKIAEAIEADRNDQYFKHYLSKMMATYKHLDRLIDREKFDFFYKKNVKGTVEEEFADIVIRLLDMTYEIYGQVAFEVFTNASVYEFDPDKGFAESAYSFVRCNIGVPVFDIVGSIEYMFAWAEHLGIDLDQHIEWKMKYNESRPYKHGGKKY